jgi:hypothetical protein
MVDGVIPSSPLAFVRVPSEEVANAGLATPPPHRCQRAPVPASLPCCNSRLAKKVFHRTSVVTTAQNMLMKKLGLSNKDQLQSIDFEKYIQLFDEGLMERQSQLILELIKCKDVAAVEPLGV